MKKKYVYIKSWNNDENTLTMNSTKTPKAIIHIERQWTDGYGEPKTNMIEVDDKKYSGGYFHYIKKDGVTYDSFCCGAEFARAMKKNF